MLRVGAVVDTKNDLLLSRFPFCEVFASLFFRMVVFVVVMVVLVAEGCWPWLLAASLRFSADFLAPKSTLLVYLPCLGFALLIYWLESMLCCPVWAKLSGWSMICGSKLFFESLFKSLLGISFFESLAGFDVE